MTDLDCLSVTIAATRAQSSSGKGFSVHSSCLSSFPLGWPCSSAGWPWLPMDGSATLWMYHSHVDEVRDTNTGLIGPLIVTKRGMARADGSPKDVERELVTLFYIMNEKESWLLRATFTTSRSCADRVRRRRRSSTTTSSASRTSCTACAATWSRC